METDEEVMRKKIARAKAFAILMIEESEKVLKLTGEEALLTLKRAHVYATDAGVALWRALHPGEANRK